MKYCVQLDVHHFYENLPTLGCYGRAGNGCSRISTFLDLHRTILASMGDGLAIGFYPSFAMVRQSWYLMWVDFRIKQRRSSLELPLRAVHGRYVHPWAITSGKLHRARDAIALELAALGMTLKRNHRLFKIGSGGVQFLSYRFFKGLHLAEKGVDVPHLQGYQAREFTKTLHRALSAISYVGLLKHCDSYNFRLARVYPLHQNQQIKEIHIE